MSLVTNVSSMYPKLLSLVLPGIGIGAAMNGLIFCVIEFMISNPPLVAIDQIINGAAKCYP